MNKFKLRYVYCHLIADIFYKVSHIEKTDDNFIDFRNFCQHILLYVKHHIPPEIYQDLFINNNLNGLRDNSFYDIEISLIKKIKEVFPEYKLFLNDLRCSEQPSSSSYNVLLFLEYILIGSYYNRNRNSISSTIFNEKLKKFGRCKKIELYQFHGEYKDNIVLYKNTVTMYDVVNDYKDDDKYIIELGHDVYYIRNVIDCFPEDLVYIESKSGLISFPIEVQDGIHDE